MHTCLIVVRVIQGFSHVRCQFSGFREGMPHQQSQKKGDGYWDIMTTNIVYLITYRSNAKTQPKSKGKEKKVLMTIIFILLHYKFRYKRGLSPRLPRRKVRRMPGDQTSCEHTCIRSNEVVGGEERKEVINYKKRTLGTHRYKTNWWIGVLS